MKKKIIYERKKANRTHLRLREKDDLKIARNLFGSTTSLHSQGFFCKKSETTNLNFLQPKKKKKRYETIATQQKTAATFETRSQVSSGYQPITSTTL